MTTTIDLKSTQSCRLCLEISDNFVNIFENYQRSTVASILAKHFWFQVSKDDGFSEWLCEICWINTTTFHDFYQRIECLQANQWNTVDANTLKQEQCDSPTEAALEPESDILECEDTKPPAPMLKLLLRKEDDCDSKGLELFDQSDGFGNSNDVTRDPKQPSNVKRKRRKQNNPEKDRQNAQICEFFIMKCDMCNDFAFETFLQVSKHYRTVHQKRGYLVCCDKKFDSRYMLLEHIRYHSNRDAFRCDTCGKCFNDKIGLKIHTKRHAPLDSRRLKKCSLCPITFSSSSALKYHVQSKHGSGETFRCDQCNKAFPSKLLQASHIRTVHVSAEYVCEICARRFKLKHMLKNHIECEHSTAGPKFQCDICGIWLKRKSGLRNHLKLHDDASCATQTCQICKKVVRKRYLAAHIRRAHGVRRHKCTLCNKAFRTTKNLKEHTAIHTGEDLYDCSYCQKKFKSNANKYSHVKKAHFAEWSRDSDKRKIVEKKSQD